MAFIHWYTKLHGRPPAEAEMEAYFQVTPSAVHQMIVTLENKGFIKRAAGQARSLRLLIPVEEVPDLDTGKPLTRKPPTSKPPTDMSPQALDGTPPEVCPSDPGFSTAFPQAASFPQVAEWINEHEGRIEIGYEYHTDTFARAIDDGGMLWGGGHRSMTVEEALQALEAALAERRRQWA